MLKITKYFIPLFLCIACYSCKPTQYTGSSLTASEVAEKNTIDFTYTFYNANKEKMLGNYELAAGLYLQSLQINPSAAAAMYELANIYFSQGKSKMALDYIRKAVELEPTNVWYNTLMAECLVNEKRYAETIRLYERLLKAYPERIDIYYELATAQLLLGKRKDALKTYNNLESRIGITEDISVQKVRIYKSLGNVDQSVNEISKLIKAFPNEGKYYGMLGEIYQENGRNEKALETYNSLLKVDPDNAYVHLSLAGYYRVINENDKSFNEMKMAFSNPALDIDTKVKILLSYYTLSENNAAMKSQAIELCEILAHVHANDAKSHSVYGDFLYRDKLLEKAREQYRAAIALDKEKYPLWNQLLIINSELNDFESMLKESEEAMELFPNQPVTYWLNGIANYQLKKYKESIEVLKLGITLVIDNKPLLGQFYSCLGDVEYKNKNYTASDQAFGKALEMDSINVQVLNNYSYYLSLREEKLEAAERMSKKSNELEPNNNSFQDTYGWILYQMGKYQEAKLWIEKAIQNGGNNSVIIEHYGDILYKLGEEKKAIQMWNDAKQKGTGSDFLDRKVADKKLYE